MKERESIYYKQTPIREREVKRYNALNPTRTWHVVDRLNHQELPGGIGFIDQRIWDYAEEEYKLKREAAHSS